MEYKKRIYINYKRQNKWLGIIEYRTLFVIYTYCIGIFLFLNRFNLQFEIFIYLYSFFLIPVISILLINSKNYSSIDMIIILLKFLMNKKIFIDMKYYKNIKNDIYVKQ